LEQRVRAQWKPTTDSWRVDETYISYLTARRTLQGYEAMNQLRKGQVHGITKGDIGSQNALSPRPLTWPPNLWICGLLSALTTQNKTRRLFATQPAWLGAEQCLSDGAVQSWCGELLRLGPALWTFARLEGVEPTNNAAERLAAGGAVAQELFRRGQHGGP
jgi:hypothetical protein